MNNNNNKELILCQKAIDPSTEVYTCTKKLSSKKRFGLLTQTSRFFVSTPSNIAEDARRNYSQAFSRFLSSANGSCYELSTQLFLSKNLQYLDEEIFQPLEVKIIEITKMIYLLKENKTLMSVLITGH